MKVLFQSRKTLFSVPGGDTVQIVKTREYLERAGVKVDISMELEPDVSRYDVVHLFNLTRPQEVFLQATNAKKQGKKAVLSTIYVSYAECEKKARRGVARFLTKVLSTGQVEYLKVAARALKNGEMNKGTATVLFRGYRSLQNRIVGMADVLLPNSFSERARLIEDFPGASAKKHVVVPNGVDTDIFTEEPGPAPMAFEKYRDCVLCVARIEARKNQLNLVRAMNQLPWQLVLIGKPAPNHAEYMEQVKKEAGPNVHILGEVEHSSLPRFYRAARVHVLASWMETTGLSSLEAGAMGCNVVITDKGDTREYFGDRAFYCEPDSVDSIRDAIRSAYNAPPCTSLTNHISKNLVWGKAAEKTMEGYHLALAG